MQTLQRNENTELTIVLPNTSGTESPTYEIFNSDGEVIKSGNLVFVRDEIWKVSSFTPTAFGLIVLKATVVGEFSTEKRENIYRVGGQG